MPQQTTVYQKQRNVDPFFLEAINTVFLRPDRQIFLMDGPIALGKTANFLAAGAYHLAHCVEPIKRKNKWVRESLWFCIRESENGAVATMREVIEDALFLPELMYDANGPYKEAGKNPKFIIIEHEIPDGTFLKMVFECHGFNNPRAESRLRSRAAMGVIIPEVQSIPWSIVELARQRSGRWRTSQTRLSKMINGKKYSLSGMEQLKIVLADANIPPRPHAMYDAIYDHPKGGAPTIIRITPPSPILPKPVSDVPKALVDSEKYPVTMFEKKQVVWLPNPKAYHMTKHFERTQVDEETGEDILGPDGKPLTVPWSGYSVWYQELNQSDSTIRRHVLGIPDTIGGASAIYQNVHEKCFLEKAKDFNPHVQVLIGYDPGNFAGFLFMQPQTDGTVYVFHEIVIEPEDGLRGRDQIEIFVVPYLKNLHLSKPAKAVSDPYALVDTSKGEGEATILKANGIQVVPCKVMNQQVKTRINCLGYYLSQGLVEIAPSCTKFITAVRGGYQWKTSFSGVISGTVNKNEFSHITEAGQYPFVNLYLETFGNKGRRSKTPVRISKIKRKSR